MSDTQTPAASPPATDATVASTPATDAPGTQVPPGYVPVAELEKAQTTARGLQSEKDKLAAKVAELSKPAESTTTPASPADPAAMFEAMERRMELREARAEFRSDERFKDADQSVFARATEFDSREAFEAALQQSAEARKSARTAMRGEVYNEIVADLKAKYPDIDFGATGNAAPPTTNGGGAPADGQMTADRLAQLPQKEFEAWVAENPKEYDRILASVS